MNKLNFIKTQYPELFQKLKNELPNGFFESPEKAPIYIKRKYNDLICIFLLYDCGDFSKLSSLQFVLCCD